MSTLKDSVIKDAEESGDYVLVELLGEFTRKERVSKLKQAFIVASQNFNDEKAETYLKWLLHAISDMYMNKPSSETEEIEISDQAMAKRVKTAIELYKKLPAYRTGEEKQLYPQNKSNYVPIGVPVLKKTRQALINEIALGWKTADTEEEADSLFEELFLLPSSSESEMKERLQIIRSATDDTFPLHRLIRHAHIAAVRFKNCERSERPINAELCKILTTAWVRNKVGHDKHYEFAGIHQQLNVLSLMENCSDEALEFIIKSCGEIASIDNRIQILRNKIKSNSELFTRCLNDQFIIEYKDTVNITTHLKRSEWATSQEEANKTFDSLLQIIRQFKEDYPEIKIHLKYSYQLFGEEPKFKQKVKEKTL